MNQFSKPWRFHAYGAVGTGFLAAITPDAQAIVVLGRLGSVRTAKLHGLGDHGAHFYAGAASRAAFLVNYGARRHMAAHDGRQPAVHGVL